MIFRVYFGSHVYHQYEKSFLMMYCMILLFCSAEGNDLSMTYIDLIPVATRSSFHSHVLSTWLNTGIWKLSGISGEEQFTAEFIQNPYKVQRASNSYHPVKYEKNVS